MKRKLTKAEFDALDDTKKGLYKALGADYVLDLVDDDDPDALRRGRDREKQIAKEQKERADRLQAEIDALNGNNARKTGDIETLERSWQSKLDTQKATYEAQVAKLSAQLEKTLVHDKAISLASKLAGDNAEIILPHLERRLKADLTGNAPFTRVLDANGELSALTVEELEKEFVANPKFSAIIVASRATGGAGGSKGNGKTPAVLRDKKFVDLTESERIDFAKADPEAFKAAADAHRQSLRRI